MVKRDGCDEVRAWVVGTDACVEPKDGCAGKLREGCELNESGVELFTGGKPKAGFALENDGSAGFSDIAVEGIGCVESENGVETKDGFDVSNVASGFDVGCKIADRFVLEVAEMMQENKFRIYQV